MTNPLATASPLHDFDSFAAASPPGAPLDRVRMGAALRVLAGTPLAALPPTAHELLLDLDLASPGGSLDAALCAHLASELDILLDPDHDGLAYVAVDGPSEHLTSFFSTQGVGDDDAGALLRLAAFAFALPSVLAASGATRLDVPGPPVAASEADARLAAALNGPPPAPSPPPSPHAAGIPRTPVVPPGSHTGSGFSGPAASPFGPGSPFAGLPSSPPAPSSPPDQGDLDEVVEEALSALEPHLRAALAEALAAALASTSPPAQLGPPPSSAPSLPGLTCRVCFGSSNDAPSSFRASLEVSLPVLGDSSGEVLVSDEPSLLARPSHVPGVLTCGICGAEEEVSARLY